MRKIERTRQFKRDYKRELKGRHRATLETTLVDVLKGLINNQPLQLVRLGSHSELGL